MILALSIFIAAAIPVFAAGGGRGGGGAPPGGFGGGPGGPGAAGVNPAANLQRLLNATTEEWNVIGPLVDRLTEATEQLDPNTVLAASSGGRGGMGNDTFNGPGDAA